MSRTQEVETGSIPPRRRLALITGGCGGIGLACARAFGVNHDLILTDLADDRLETAASLLRDEGYIIRATPAGDFASDAVLDTLEEVVRDWGPLGVLVHAAGLSPAMADWKTIIKVNAIGTTLLLNRIERMIGDGMVGVLISSMAGHVAPQDAAVDALLDDPLQPGMIKAIEPELQRVSAAHNRTDIGMPASAYTKRAMIRMAERRAEHWARVGARIVSISPGVTWTPMGRLETAQDDAANVLDHTPIRRWCTAMDVAQAALFLASDRAGYITGTDLRIDGGALPAQYGVRF